MTNIYRTALFAFGMFAGLVAAPLDAKIKATGNKVATPAAQALKIYQAVRDQDYRAMFFLLAFTPRDRATLTSPDKFALDVRKGYDESFKSAKEKAESDALLASISHIKIGNPVISNGRAVIPTASNITINGKAYKFNGTAYLILDDGAWKLDLTIDQSSEKAMAQRISELMGKPDLGNGY